MAERTLKIALSEDYRENIVLKARRGDIDAFERLVTGCERTLYRVSRTVLRNEQDCADAVQEALTKAWLRLDTLREPQYFRTWLIRILLNECYGILKRRKRSPGNEESAGRAVYDSPSDDAMDLRDALQTLPEDQRTALVLYHVEDLTVDEISRVMNAPSGTVKSWLARARTRLAAFMRPKEDNHVRGFR